MRAIDDLAQAALPCPQVAPGEPANAGAVLKPQPTPPNAPNGTSGDVIDIDVLSWRDHP